MRRLSVVISAILLCGCAQETLAVLTRRPPERTYTSSHNHRDVAECIARVTGAIEPSMGDDFASVGVMTANGIAYYYDIRPSPNGSVIKAWRSREWVRGLPSIGACLYQSLYSQYDEALRRPAAA